MTIRTRLAVIVGVVIVAGGLITGGISAKVARDDAISHIAGVLNDAVERVRLDPALDTSLVVQFAESSPIPISASMFFRDDKPISLVDGMDGSVAVIVPVMSTSMIKDTEGSARRFPGSVIVRSLQVGDGEWMTVAASTSDVDAQFRQSLLRSLQASFVIAIAMVFISFTLIRRTLSPVVSLTNSATSIASGNLETRLPVAEGRNEIAQLTEALTTMVESLRGAVDVTTNSERRMREFLGDASHELRTPLTVIRGYIDILDSGRDLSPDQRDRAMRRLVGESLRMSEIINDLLLLAELGEVRESMEDVVDLGELVEDHARDLMAQQPERAVTLRIQPGLTVRGNRPHLHRALSNVFANIARHTDRDAPVDVSVADDQTAVVVTVNDGGPGLDDALYERSTTGFQRFDKGRSPEGGGFGLGLSIIASVVGAHHGTFEMSKSPLGGLRTVIRLPRQLQ